MNNDILLYDDSIITSKMIDDNNEINLTIIVKPTNTLYDILYNNSFSRDEETIWKIHIYVREAYSENLKIFNTNVKINMKDGKYFIIYNCTVKIESSTSVGLTITFTFNIDEDQNKNDNIINFYDINDDIPYDIFYTDENDKNLVFFYSYFNPTTFKIYIGYQRQSVYNDEQYKKILSLIEIFD